MAAQTKVLFLANRFLVSLEFLFLFTIGFLCQGTVTLFSFPFWESSACMDGITLDSLLHCVFFVLESYDRIFFFWGGGDNVPFPPAEAPSYPPLIFPSRPTLTILAGSVQVIYLLFSLAPSESSRLPVSVCYYLQLFKTRVNTLFTLPFWLSPPLVSDSRSFSLSPFFDLYQRVALSFLSKLSCWPPWKQVKVFLPKYY